MLLSGVNVICIIYVKKRHLHSSYHGGKMNENDVPFIVDNLLKFLHMGNPTE